LRAQALAGGEHKLPELEMRVRFLLGAHKII